MSKNIYASIDQYLEDKHQELETLFALLNYELKPGKRGLTLLLPDKDLMKDLQDLHKEKSETIKKYSHEVDYLKKEYDVKDSEIGHSLARWFLQALTLTQYYPTGESFKEGKIVNKLFRTYEVTNASKDKAELSIGEVTKDHEFTQLENMGPGRTPKLAIWYLKGKPKIDTPEFTFTKSGGVNVDKIQDQGMIASHIWYKVEICKKEHKDMELVYIVSLLNFVKKEDAALYKNLLSVISWNPLVSLALILQPGNKESLVPHHILTKWIKDTYFNIENNAKEKYKNICDEACLDQLELTNELKAKIDNIGEYSTDSARRIYMQMMKYFPVYKSVDHKINHDILRYHYETEPIVYQRFAERLSNVDTVLGQHSLNPKQITVNTEDLESFIHSFYFVFHCRPDQDTSALSVTTSPTFNISQQKINDLISKING